MTEGAQPILYSFRRCPYAMRARLAITIAKISLELREVSLSNKPQAMLEVSPKGTVPVLQLENGQIIDESLEIMFWALQQNDPENWISTVWLADAKELIGLNDTHFKSALDRYKYADRYPQQSQLYYRQQGEFFLGELENRLNRQDFLCADRFTLADAAILPFIRQFAAVDQDWFRQSPYAAVNRWLEKWTSSVLFGSIMRQQPIWQPGNPLLRFEVS